MDNGLSEGWFQNLDTSNQSFSVDSSSTTCSLYGSGEEALQLKREEIGIKRGIQDTTRPNH